MPRKILIFFLSVCLLFEAGLTLLSFFKRPLMLHQLGFEPSAVADLLGYIIAWFCLLVCLLCTYALRQVYVRGPYTALCYLLGLWWVGIGIGIYVAFGRPSNLVTDTIKGALLVALTWWSGRKTTEESKQ